MAIYSLIHSGLADLCYTAFLFYVILDEVV